MNEKIAAATAPVKNFIVRHKTKIAVTAAVVATATVSIAMNRSALRQRDEFIDEHGLTDAFNAKFEDPTQIEA